MFYDKKNPIFSYYITVFNLIYSKNKKCKYFKFKKHLINRSASVNTSVKAVAKYFSRVELHCMFLNGHSII